MASFLKFTIYIQLFSISYILKEVGSPLIGRIYQKNNLCEASASRKLLRKQWKASKLR
jgi:hypothetical protein